MYIHVVVSSHVKGNLVMKSYFGGRVEVFPSYAGKKICRRKQIIKPLNQIRPDEDEVHLCTLGCINWLRFDYMDECKNEYSITECQV